MTMAAATEATRGRESRMAQSGPGAIQLMQVPNRQEHMPNRTVEILYYLTNP